MVQNISYRKWKFQFGRKNKNYLLRYKKKTIPRDAVTLLIGTNQKPNIPKQIRIGYFRTNERNRLRYWSKAIPLLFPNQMFEDDPTYEVRTSCQLLRHTRRNYRSFSLKYTKACFTDVLMKSISYHLPYLLLLPFSFVKWNFKLETYLFV